MVNVDDLSFEGTRSVMSVAERTEISQRDSM